MKKEIAAAYAKIRADIDRRLSEFEEVWHSGSGLELFREMAFCMCTPQTSAHKSWNAVSELYNKNRLAKGGEEEIAAALREAGVRFHNHKAHYIVQNRAAFYPKTRECLAEILQTDDPHGLLCRRVAGWGLKEAAHFLRNIGFGGYAAILDRHILRRLAAYKVIPEIPAVLTKPVYLEISARMKDFASDCGIPLAALDLVFWYEETGEIFK